MSDSPKIEGYWYSQSSQEYPVPEPNMLTHEEAKAIHTLIKKKEQDAHVTAYMGWSTSRITGEALGSTEFQLDGWRWPDSFADHYVLKHRVKPTVEFLKWIGYIDQIMDYKSLYDEMSKRLNAIRRVCLRVNRSDLMVDVHPREKDLSKLILKQTMGHKLDILDE